MKFTYSYDEGSAEEQSEEGYDSGNDVEETAVVSTQYEYIQEEDTSDLDIEVSCFFIFVYTCSEGEGSGENLEGLALIL